MAKDDNKEGEMNRRDFLGKAVTGAVAAGGFYCVGLKAAVAEMRRAAVAPARPGSPALNVGTLNSVLQNKALLGQIGADPKHFLTEHFALTPAQLRDVEGLRPDEISAIRKAVETAQRENLNIKADCQRGGMMMDNAQVVAQSARLNVTKIGTPGAAGHGMPGANGKSAPPKMGGTLKVSLSGFGQ